MAFVKHPPPPHGIGIGYLYIFALNTGISVYRLFISISVYHYFLYDASLLRACSELEDLWGLGSIYMFFFFTTCWISSGARGQCYWRVSETPSGVYEFVICTVHTCLWTYMCHNSSACTVNVLWVEFPISHLAKTGTKIIFKGSF